MRSVYATARSFRFITMYATSLVLVFGVGEIWKLSALSSAYKKSSNNWPGFFLIFSELKCFNMESKFGFLFLRIWCSSNSGVLYGGGLEPMQLVWGGV